MTSSTVELRLSRTLSLVNEWLRFAEAKNGAIVAAAFGVAFGITQLIPKGFFAEIGWPQLYVIAFLSQLFLSVCMGVTSFLPVTDIRKLLPSGEKSETDNLLFFGDLMKYSPDALLAEVQERQLPEAVDGASRIDRDFAEQIIINARITSWKFICSKWAIRLFLSALLTPILVVPGIALTRRRVSDRGM